MVLRADAEAVADMAAATAAGMATAEVAAVFTPEADTADLPGTALEDFEGEDIEYVARSFSGDTLLHGAEVQPPTGWAGSEIGSPPDPCGGCR